MILYLSVSSEPELNRTVSFTRRFVSYMVMPLSVKVSLLCEPGYSYADHDLRGIHVPRVSVSGSQPFSRAAAISYCARL